MSTKRISRCGIALATALMLGGNTPASANLSGLSDTTIAKAFAGWQVGIEGLAAIRRPEENWAAAKSRAQQADWAKWLGEARGSLDRWMVLQREDPTKPVGWAHDYVDPKTGAFLTWSPDSAPPPPGTSDKIRAAWAMEVRAYNIGQILEAARLYRLLGEVRYRDWAVAQLDAYAANYSTLPLQNWHGQAHLFNQALDEAVYGFQLIEVVRLLRQDTPRETLDHWQRGLFEPMVGNLMRSEKSGNNIAVWLAAAVAAIGAEFDLPAAQDFGLKSDRGLLTLLERGVSQDYFWYEMSLHYQQYVVGALSRWLYAARIRGAESPTVLRIGHITRNLMLAPLALRFGNGESPMLNDSIGYRRIPDRQFWAGVWRVLPTKIGIAQAIAEKSWNNLLDSPPSLQGAASLPPPSSQRVDGLDAVQLVAEGWQALIRYGQRAPGHSHQESLTYDLQYKGVWLFRDPGTVAYGSPLHSGYFKRAHAQNVPLIDRDGQSPWPSEGEVVSFDPKLARTDLMHRGYQKGHNVSREIRAQAAAFVDQVRFSLGEKKRLPVGLVFNTGCRVLPGDGLAAAKDDSLKQTGPFRYWTERREFSVGPRIRLDLECEGARFSMTFAGADIKTLCLARTPDTEKGGARTGIYVETSPVAEALINVRIDVL